ncbi:MAG TPA: glycosyltransferase family 9 protein [Dokdonella sp.]|nr:glycosyltransferase family 9 protein [Dokdonella sp.]
MKSVDQPPAVRIGFFEAMQALLTSLALNIDIQHLRRRMLRFGVLYLRRPRQPDLANSKPIPRSGIYRILLCRPNHRLGNLLLLTPLLVELQRSFPGTQVDLVVGGNQAASLFKAFPNVGNVFRLPRHALREPLRFIRVLRALRRERYDLAIDPDVQSMSSRLLVDRCRASYRIGFTGAKPARGLSRAMQTPVVERHMGQLPVLLLRWAVELPDGAIRYRVPALDLQLTADEREWGRRRLAELLQHEHGAANGEVVAIFTHATGAKRYSDSWWQDMLASLRHQYPESRFIEILPAHARSSFAGAIPGYFSTTPRRMAAIIAATQLFLTADCGVMHLACAARGPAVVGLFSCTDPAVYGPYGGSNHAFSTAGLAPAELCRQIGESIAR